MTLTEIRAALTTRGLRPLRQLGQNFLHDKNLAAWLAEQALAGAAPEAEVVEIGPGLGALTAFLLQRGARVVAVEKDRGLCAFLRERFAPELASGKLDLRHGDALELLPALAPARVCGNLPYYISTPLLMECLRLDAEQLFFVMQKEVGQRLASTPGGKVYGALSVLVQVAYDVELVRTLPGSVFFPAARCRINRRAIAAPQKSRSKRSRPRHLRRLRPTWLLATSQKIIEPPPRPGRTPSRTSQPRRMDRHLAFDQVAPKNAVGSRRTPGDGAGK